MIHLGYTFFYHANATCDAIPPPFSQSSTEDPSRYLRSIRSGLLSLYESIYRDGNFVYRGHCAINFVWLWNKRLISFTTKSIVLHVLNSLNKVVYAGACIGPVPYSHLLSFSVDALRPMSMPSHRTPWTLPFAYEPKLLFYHPIFDSLHIVIRTRIKPLNVTWGRRLVWWRWEVLYPKYPRSWRKKSNSPLHPIHSLKNTSVGKSS
jgi:hypothetical protein